VIVSYTEDVLTASSDQIQAAGIGINDYH